MKLTIFTPTYNRKNEICELFNNISNEYEDIDFNDDIEWIIVDDGSTDDYSNIIANIKFKAKFDICYLKKENGGKHSAYNKAIELATGDIFVCMDDDDRFYHNSLTNIFRISKYVVINFGKNVCGFAGRAVDSKGFLLGKDNNHIPMLSNTIEIRDRYIFWGEPEIYFTKILKNYKFDIFDDEKFLTEAYLFDDLTIKYPLYYTNDKIIVKKYLKNGLSDKSLELRLKNPNGAEAYYNKRKKHTKGFLNKVKVTINRQRFSYRIINNKPKRNCDIYELIAFPFSILLSFFDSLICKKNNL